MQIGDLQFHVKGSESLPPDEAKAAEIFSRIGYSIEDAIADLVDNSIDAKARNVLVRFLFDSYGIQGILIADDGSGMDDATLKEAMRFGSKTTKAGTELGKYGIGLKTASLGQANSVTVVSRLNGVSVGRRWTKENIKHDWNCEILEPRDCARFLGLDFGPVRIRKKGTVVFWEHLEHLKAIPETLPRVLEDTRKILSIELGLRFHRFIEDERVSIFLDAQEVGDELESVAVPVLPLNPFDYPVSGDANYPRAFTIQWARGTSIEIECHIWPAKSNRPGFRLGGGRVSSRQGFYFYRNDRIIQAGGWNGCRADDSEPHLSLARVRVELPARMDSIFKLDIAKSNVDPPPSFQPAVLSASSGPFNFLRYVKDADGAYRKQKDKDSIRFPFVPGAGFPATAKSKIALALREDPSFRPEEVAFKWRSLGHDEIVAVDAVKHELILNSKFRRVITCGSENDGAMIKLLMLFLLQQNLKKSFETEKGRDWLHRINMSLLSCLQGR